MLKILINITRQYDSWFGDSFLTKYQILTGQIEDHPLFPFGIGLPDMQRRQQEQQMQQVIPKYYFYGKLSAIEGIKYATFEGARFILFLDSDIISNYAGFKKALANLTRNKNIPVILLTKESKDSIVFKLRRRNISPKEIEFKTLDQLGLKDVDLEKFKRPIEGLIEELQSISLTDSLCNKYEVLKKARTQL
jgi:hypothetical protein